MHSKHQHTRTHIDIRSNIQFWDKHEIKRKTKASIQTDQNTHRSSTYRRHQANNNKPKEKKWKKNGRNRLICGSEDQIDDGICRTPLHRWINAPNWPSREKHCSWPPATPIPENHHPKRTKFGQRLQAYLRQRNQTKRTKTNHEGQKRKNARKSLKRVEPSAHYSSIYRICIITQSPLNHCI